MAGRGDVQGGHAPGRTPGPVVLRWGLPDAAIVWFAGLLCAVVGTVVAANVTGVEVDSTADEPIVLGVSALAQFGGMVGVLWLIARIKGRGSLAADFGLVVSAREWWYVLVGIGTQLAAQVLLLPIAVLDDRRQGVVEDLEDSSGLALVILVLLAALVAPVVEELLFRGLLLRALLRRMPPALAVGWCAAIFGVVHLVDPDAIVVLPALVGVGVVAGIVAVRAGSVGPAILVHVGFNLVTVLALVGS